MTESLKSLQGHVLIVDDDDLIADFYEIVMEIGQLDFKLAGTLDEAREVFQTQLAAGRVFSALIMDLCLSGPYCSPLPWIKEVKTTSPGLRVLIVTGAPHLIHKDPLFDEVVDMLLPKPIKPSVLLSALGTSGAP